MVWGQDWANGTCWLCAFNYEDGSCQPNTPGAVYGSVFAVHAILPKQTCICHGKVYFALRC